MKRRVPSVSAVRQAGSAQSRSGRSSRLRNVIADGRSLQLEVFESRSLLAAGGIQQLTNLIGFESATAVDPNNPLIVAVAQYNQVQISRDGGRTFPATVTVTAPTPGFLDTRGGDPTLSFDANGNLYFGYLSNDGNPANPNFTLGVFAAVIDPQTGTILQNVAIAQATATTEHDKEWIAADTYATSPFRNNAYMVWSQLGNNQILFSRSTNGGQTWSAPTQLDPGGQGFVWPSEVAVGSNGDVYVAWHTETANNAGNLGGVVMRRSSDGGQTFGPALVPFPGGTADVTDNVPNNPLMPGSRAWMQGAVQPRILVDPVRPNQIYVLCVDDPDNDYANGDPANVVMARSIDGGATWTRSTISNGPNGTMQTMPAAAIDRQGNIAVTWYDNRANRRSIGIDQISGNADDLLQLDVFASVSLNGGLTFSPDFLINEASFDPDLGPPTDRFPPNNVFRIGEYNGLAAESGFAYASWTANNGTAQDIAFDVFSLAAAFPDAFEGNDTLASATDLGSPIFTNLNATIHPGLTGDDVDYYRVVAHYTGKTTVRLSFNHRAGNLDLRVQDAVGSEIGSSTDVSDNERVTFAAVAGETYYLRVNGVAQNTNAYALEVQNFTAPTPSIVELDPAVDSGSTELDYVTFSDRPRVVVQADLLNFVDENRNGAVDFNELAILNAAQHAANLPGLAVRVTATDVNTGEVVTGIANRLPAPGHSPLFEFEFPADSLGAPGTRRVWEVSSAVEVTDGALIRGRTQLSEGIRLLVDRASPSRPTISMLFGSDSGAFDNDRVTRVNAIAFSGIAEANTRVILFANSERVGEAFTGSDSSDRLPGNGLGAWEITSEPLTDGTYIFAVQTEDLAGNLSNFSEELTVTIDTTAPNLPYLDLAVASDSGRSNVDNITNDNTPTVTSTVDDLPVIGSNPTPNDIRYRIYDRLGTGPETLLVDSFIRDGAALTSGAFFSDTLAAAAGGPLADGVHNLKLEVEDRAGNISSTTLTITIDTVAPPAPSLAFDPAATDSGVPGLQGTYSDRATNVTAPGFQGRAESDAKVHLFVDASPITDSLLDDTAAGLTVAVPFDGNFAGGNAGAWKLTTTVDFNDAQFPRDGRRQVSATAEDVAGNVSEATQLQTFLDTQGPRVTQVSIDQATGFDLFDPKPSSGPTPLVNSLIVQITDPGARASTDFLYPALAFLGTNDPVLLDGGEPSLDPGQYQLVGDANGIIPIRSISYISVPVVANQLAVAALKIEFFKPLPDDRFTLTIKDGLVDPVGNHLDGESNAVQPLEDPSLPSGDGRAGGHFAARFTVDSRPEIGVWGAGGVHVDTNGNFRFDPTNPDYVNRDLSYTFGFTSDDVFAGNFTSTDRADGWDKLAAYGHINGGWRFIVDTNNDGVYDLRVVQPSQNHLNGVPVAGNFDGNLANGDEVGIFTGDHWNLDRVGKDYIVDSVIATNYRGLPVVGDFDGNGTDDLAVWSDDTFTIDFNQDGVGDSSFRFGFPGVRERPVAADFDRDGFEDLGLFVPDRAGPDPQGVGQWYLLYSGGAALTTRLQASEIGGQEIRFSPIPLGKDLFAQFGDAFALPIVGNFDPPVATRGERPRPATNPLEPLDVNGDNRVSIQDILQLVNELNRPERSTNLSKIYYDPSGDGRLSVRDILQIVNRLNQEAHFKTVQAAAPAPVVATAGEMARASAGAAVTAALQGTAQESSELSTGLLAKRRLG